MTSRIIFMVEKVKERRQTNQGTFSLDSLISILSSYQPLYDDFVGPSVMLSAKRMKLHRRFTLLFTISWSVRPTVYLFS